MLIRIITIKDVTYTTECTMMIAQGENGEFGVLPQHINFVAAISVGVIKIYKDSICDKFFVDKGLVHVYSSSIDVFTNQAINLNNNIDPSCLMDNEFYQNFREYLKHEQH